ncbi:MAG: 50S ribosomal protein L9 [Eubacterium sp.]|nr:50S ribosomal protein L9 [Eubacterium sp.]
MKVILLEDVKSLGKKGEIVEVNDGYARNFILPKKKGVEADSKHLNDLKLQKKNDEKVAQEKLDEAQALSQKLATESITIKMDAGVEGKLFGSISTKDVANEAKNQLGLEFDKKKVVLPENIKSLGTYDVKIKLHPEVQATLTIKVVAK